MSMSPDSHVFHPCSAAARSAKYLGKEERRGEDGGERGRRGEVEG